MSVDPVAITRTEPTGESGSLWGLLTPQPWVQDALCAQTDPDLFFPEGKGADARDAKKVCASCPVVAECLEYALRNNERRGVWGGKSVLERARIRRARNAA